MKSNSNFRYSSCANRVIQAQKNLKYPQNIINNGNLSNSETITNSNVFHNSNIPFDNPQQYFQQSSEVKRFSNIPSKVIKTIEVNKQINDSKENLIFNTRQKCITSQINSINRNYNLSTGKLLSAPLENKENIINKDKLNETSKEELLIQNANKGNIEYFKYENNSENSQRKPFEFLQIEEDKRSFFEEIHNNMNFNINDLRNMTDEKQKWRYFGYLLSQAYDQLKEDYVNLQNQIIAKDLVIQKLNEQIKSSTIMKNMDNIPERIPDSLLGSEIQRFVPSTTMNAIKKAYNKEIQSLKEENKQLNNEKLIQQKTIEKLLKKLKNSKEKLQKIVELTDFKDEKNMKGMYKILSEKHLNMCTTFADQVICLQTDLEETNRKKLLNKPRDSQCLIQIKQSLNEALSPKATIEDINIPSSERKQTFLNVVMKNNLPKSNRNSLFLANSHKKLKEEKKFNQIELKKNSNLLNSNPIEKCNISNCPNKKVQIQIKQKY